MFGARSATSSCSRISFLMQRSELAVFFPPEEIGLLSGLGADQAPVKCKGRWVVSLALRNGLGAIICLSPLATAHETV